MEPLVSVVIPIYNVEKYLDRCIESVVNQTYKSIEIILVDDGSTDSCPQICDDWADKDSRIRVVHKSNEGLGMARNTGIDNATGKYIFFFDSDDYVDTTIVEKCVKKATRSNSQVVILGRYDVYDDGRSVSFDINASKDIFEGEEIINLLLPAMLTYSLGFGISSCGRMFDLDVFRRTGKRFASEREIISEDAYFAIDFYPEIDRAALLDENLYFYYKRENSLSKSYKADRQYQNDIFYLKTIELAKAKKIDSKISRYIAIRYQMYTVAAMKQVCTSNLEKKQKSKELMKIFKSEVLQTTLRNDIIAHHSKGLKIFFTCLRYKLYPLCTLVLKVKAR